MFNIPPELKQAIIDNKLIAFVGAGLSYDLYNINGHQIKGWVDLVSNMLFHLKDIGHDVDCLIPLTSKYPPITVLDLIEKDKLLPKSEIYNFVKNHFDLNHNNQNNNYDVHMKINNLCNKIITTNYDDAFENIDRELSKNTAYKGKNYELTTHKNKNSKLLFKLHGCFKDADSMVLFPSNYENLYGKSERDSEHSLSVLKNIILNNSLLFIGSGMGDYQIENIFLAIKNLQGEYNQKHFIITKDKPLDPRLDFLTPIYINDYSEIDNILDKLLEIKTNYKSKEQEENERLKKDLEDALKKFSELEFSIPNKDRLIEKANLIFLSRGIDYQLSQNYDDAIKEYRLSLEFDPNNYDALFNLGRVLTQNAAEKTYDEACSLYEEAFEKYSLAFKINPKDCYLLNNWAIHLSNYAELKSSTNSASLYEEAFEKYSLAFKIDPKYYYNLYNWATSLSNYAILNYTNNKNFIYQQSFEKYSLAFKIKTNDPSLLSNWAIALSNYAKLNNSDSFYQQAFKKYSLAVEIDSHNHKILNNWATDLSDYAKLNNSNSDSLYQQAFEKYSLASQINPEDYTILYNWGVTLSDYSKTKKGISANNLLESSTEKYKSVLKITPDDKNTLYNLSSNLILHSKVHKDDERNLILQDAIEYSLKCINLGGGCYNYACANALLNSKEIAFEFLDKSLSDREINIQDIQNDDEWSLFKNDSDFINIIEKYKI